MSLLCRRCGDELTLHVVGQVHCRKCQREVRTAIAESEAKRPVQRFPFAKDFSPFGGRAA